MCTLAQSLPIYYSWTANRRINYELSTVNPVPNALRLWTMIHQPWSKLFPPHLQSVNSTLCKFLTNHLENQNVCVPLQPANEERILEKDKRKTNFKNKKNKVCRIKKGFYLCSPKRKGRWKAKILKAIFSIKIEKSSPLKVINYKVWTARRRR
jgi:hypothetical protein